MIIFFRACATLCELETKIIPVTRNPKLIKRSYQLIFRWEANWKRRVSPAKQNILNTVIED